MTANDRASSRRDSGYGDDRLSDPPVLPPAAEPPAPAAPGRPTFPEFARGTLPEWALVRLRFDPTEIANVRDAVRSALDPVMVTIQPGARVCLAVGSRGIDRIDGVVRAVVERVREALADGKPAAGDHSIFICPDGNPLRKRPSTPCCTTF